MPPFSFSFTLYCQWDHRYRTERTLDPPVATGKIELAVRPVPRADSISNFLFNARRNVATLRDAPLGLIDIGFPRLRRPRCRKRNDNPPFQVHCAPRSLFQRTRRNVSSIEANRNFFIDARPGPFKLTRSRMKRYLKTNEATPMRGFSSNFQARNSPISITSRVPIVSSVCILGETHETDEESSVSFSAVSRTLGEYEN